MAISATIPKPLTVVGTIVPASVNTASTIAALLTSASLSGVTHMTLQANAATVYIRVTPAGSAASSSNYGISLAVGEKIDLFALDWTTVSVQGTSATVSALCYSASI